MNAINQNPIAIYQFETNKKYYRVECFYYNNGEPVYRGYRCNYKPEMLGDWNDIPCHTRADEHKYPAIVAIVGSAMVETAKKILEEKR